MEILSVYERNGVWRPAIDGRPLGDAQGFTSKAAAIAFYTRWFAARIADGDLVWCDTCKL